jgi:hypothetical protein
VSPTHQEHGLTYFEHTFETRIARHSVGTYRYTVVYLDSALHAVLPLDRHARLRVEADIGGLPVKGAWQPAKGRWYLMLPKDGLKRAGLVVGASVEVAFRVLPQDEVEIPPPLAELLQAMPRVRTAWRQLSPGKQRGLAHMVASAKRAHTQTARLAKVEAILLGEEPPPWSRQDRTR